MNFFSSVTFKQSAKMSRKITHCIFDMDGLILDTETLYTEGTQKILDLYGNKTFTWDIKATLMGLHTIEAGQKLIEIYELPITIEEYLILKKKYVDNILGNSNVMPDTETIYKKMIDDIAKSFGKIYDLKTQMKITGTTEQRTCEIAVQNLELPITVNEFTKIYCQMGFERLGNAKLMGGAEKLIRHLHEHKIPICLATSSAEPIAKVKIENHKELFSLFNHSVMGSTDPEVKEGKPSPDIFLIAASRFPNPPNPENCLVFEDAPNGVKAAISAGMEVVMVPDPRCPIEERKLATCVLNSLEDIKLEEFGLPPYK